MKTKSLGSKVTALIAMSGVALLSGCGKQAFNITPTAQTSQAAGTYTIPAKVDIVLALDDTGSILPIQSEVKAEIPNFLANLESKNWDYRFTMLPLTKISTSSNNPITQVAPARYDGNWGKLWTSPFPGANPSVGKVDSSLFRIFSAISGISAPIFNFTVNANTSSAGVEKAFEALSTNLKRDHSQQKFIRSDALLAIVIVSNGQDTSGLKTCIANDGQSFLCDDQNKPAELSAENLNAQKAALTSIKPSSPNGTKVYSIVSPSVSCRGSKAFKGSRYSWMSNATGGQAYDLCQSNAISSALSAISSHLQVVKLSKKQSYVVINQEPEESSIRVFKLTSGGAEIEIPRNAVNGWVYEGGPRSEYEIHDPVTERLKYGYVIRLNGNAIASGEEVAYATFTAKGAKE